MEKLASFQNNDPAVLLQLTKQLIERDFFLTFLTHSQLKVLTRIVKSNDLNVWKHFLEGKIVIEVEDTAEPETDADLGEFDEDFVTQLVMKVRYLLWEKAIDFYYLSESMLNKGLEEVTDDFELIDGLKMDENVAEETKNEEEEPAAPVREEEDDYDDDDEDDKEEEKQEDSAQGQEEDVEMAETNYSDNKAVIKVPAQELAEDTKKDEENSVAEVPSELIKELNKAYHTFEYDRETLFKRRKLEKSNQQLDSDSKSEEAIKKENDPVTDENGVSTNQAASESNLAPATFGVGTTSLRNLLNTIQSHRDQIPLDEHELRMLFMDVRKNRSKWANDERVGQEELYEACERVVLDLRGYTEHSTPFLNKVSKREAPNYGLIIKKPMDLNTVMKKLKSFSYNSKAEFVDDLMLIWSNCLTYNADPKHFLRAHAIAMQKRTQKLIPTIPDITIKHRLEIEKEEDDREASIDPEGSSGAGAGKGLQRHTIKEEAEASVAEETPEVETVEDPEHVPEEVQETNDNQPSLTVPQAESDPAPVPDAENNDDTSRQIDGNESDSDMEVDNTENQNEGDQDWRLLTAKSRANYCSERAALFDSENHLRLDAPAILRKSNEMDNFSHYLTGNESVSKSNSLLENEEPYILEYDVAGGLPGIKYRGVSTEDQDKYEQELVDKFLEVAEADANSIKSAFALSQDSGLNKVYTETITEIQEVRKICSKISLVRQMQTQSFVHHSQMKQPEIETIKEIDIDPILKLSNHDPFHELIQYPVLRRNIAKIAMQTGFETTQPFAINTLTQVAARYMSNLIKTVKTHCELVSLNHLSNAEVILVSLVENGVNKPDDLYTFVKERVLKQQAKLKDLRQKLSNFLRDLLRPGLENFNERSFEDNSEQFITGDFSSDLGDDFFGFKELGLDKEFKMLSLSIPIYLLHSRLHNSYSSTGNELKRNKYSDLEELPPIKLAASDINDQIELIRPFYQQLVEKTKSYYVKSQKKKGESTELPPDEELYIIEDEELPQKQRNVRPRLPPTGKISSTKKKPLSSGYFLPEVA